MDRLFFSGLSYEGGISIDSEAPVSRLPLFIRGGSIIPTGEATEYADAQTGGPITVSVYPGADAEFIFYEDEGDNYKFWKKGGIHDHSLEMEWKTNAA